MAVSSSQWRGRREAKQECGAVGAVGAAAASSEVAPEKLSVRAYVVAPLPKPFAVGKISQKSPKYTKISQKNGEISGQVYPCPTLLSI